MLGLFAVLFAGACSVAEGAWYYANGIENAFTPGLAVGLAGLLPQLVVVYLFWGMGREIGSLSFQGASLCLFGVNCAWEVLFLAHSEILPGDWPWFVVEAVAISMGLFVLVALGFWIALTRRKGGCLIPLAIGGLLLTQVIMHLSLVGQRGAPRANQPNGVPAQQNGRQPPNEPGRQPHHGDPAAPNAAAEQPNQLAKLPIDEAVKLVALFALLCYAVFTLWFAMAKIGRWKQLGNLAVAVGAAQLIGMCTSVTQILFGVWSYEDGVLVGMIMDGGTSLLTAWWFARLRDQAEHESPRSYWQEYLLNKHALPDEFGKNLE
jgi:hypothetical protein